MAAQSATEGCFGQGHRKTSGAEVVGGVEDAFEHQQAKQVAQPTLGLEVDPRGLPVSMSWSKRK